MGELSWQKEQRVSAARRIVYPRVETIFARKKNGQLYRHDFDNSAPLIGEPDGSLRIPGRPEKWAVIDGEPWMVNAPVEKRRRRKAGRRRKGLKRSVRKGIVQRTAARRARARAKRNHALAVYALANRPDEDTMARRRNRKGRYVKGAYMKRKSHGKRRRARRITYRASVRRPARRRSRRRGYRRNPPMMGGFLGRLVPPLEPVLMAVAGATVTRFITNQVEEYFPNLAVTTDPATQLPVENKMGRTAIKIASALLTGLAGGMILGRARGSQLAAGGLVIVTDELLRTEVLPRVGLSEFVEPYEVMGEYIDQPRGMTETFDGEGMPGGSLLSDGGDDDLSEFMEGGMGAFGPGRLDPTSRLN